MAVDFPRAWQIARGTPAQAHDPKCSYRREGGALLCDCYVLTRHPEYQDKPLHGVKERGLIFTGESIAGLLSGVKTQSRRVIMPRNEGMITGPASEPYSAIEAYGGGARHKASRMECRTCPYGVPGDLIWVKEAFALSVFDPEAMEHDIKNPDDWDAPVYKADPQKGEWERDGEKIAPPWRSPRFMPKWVARIWLELTGVRVERLQAISEADVLAEGLRRVTKDQGRTYKYGMADRDGLPGTDDIGWPWHRWSADHRAAYASLWDELNAKRGFPWSENWWVWILEFRLIDKPS